MVTMNSKCGSLKKYGQRGWRKNANFYCLEEDISIINEVLVRIDKFTVGGNTLWISIEDCGVLPNRTWQSIKERFRKTIYPRLNKYKISDSDKKILKDGFMKVHCNTRRKNRLKLMDNSKTNRRASERLKSINRGTKTLSSDGSVEIEDDSDWSEPKQVCAVRNEKHKKRKLFTEETLLGPVSPITALKRPGVSKLRECRVQIKRVNNLMVGDDGSAPLKCVVPESRDCHEQYSHENVLHENIVPSSQFVTDTILEKNTQTDLCAREAVIAECNTSEIESPRVGNPMNSNIFRESEASGTCQLVGNSQQIASNVEEHCGTPDSGTGVKLLKNLLGEDLSAFSDSRGESQSIIDSTNTSSVKQLPAVDGSCDVAPSRSSSSEENETIENGNDCCQTCTETDEMSLLTDDSFHEIDPATLESSSRGSNFEVSLMSRDRETRTGPAVSTRESSLDFDFTDLNSSSYEEGCCLQ